MRSRVGCFVFRSRIGSCQTSDVARVDATYGIKRTSPQDPKSACQEWAQHNFKCLPIYKTIEQMGTEHEPVFKVQVKVGKLTAFGVGHNKKEAEKEAARNLLEQHHG